MKDNYKGGSPALPKQTVKNVKSNDKIRDATNKGKSTKR
jgi:hypothetical protein